MNKKGLTIEQWIERLEKEEKETAEKLKTMTNDLKQCVEVLKEVIV